MNGQLFHAIFCSFLHHAPSLILAMSGDWEVIRRCHTVGFSPVVPRAGREPVGSGIVL